VNRSTIKVSMLGILLAGVGLGWAQAEGEKLPAGPIRERHELMEELGSRAKKIGDTMRAGKTEGIAENADAIQAASKRLPGLFPKGSSVPGSRAKEEIWKDWDRFERDAQALTDAAGRLAEAARAGQDVEPASGQMFQACKGCHQAFRLPEK
jgi:cytochrome c556